MDRNDYDDDFEVDSDEDEGDDEEGGADIERPRNRPSLLCFLVDASKLMIDTHPFTKDERDDQKSYSIRSDVRSYYGLAMSALSNACREQVKKGLADQVGVILFNCDSGDAKDSQGVYCLREIKPLDCGFITMIDRHGKEGTYTQDSSLKAIDLKPSDGVCPQKDKGDTPSYQCHLLTALQEARDMFGKVAGKATEMRKTICVLTCSDDPLGGAVKSQVRLLRKKALLGKCHDIKDFNIHIDVYPLQHDVTLDGFPPDSDGPAPPATRDVFRAGIIFKQLLTLSEVPFDTEAGKEVANKCIQCNDDLECAGKKVLQRVEEMLCDRHVGQLQDDIEARILMMRSLGSMRWILEWGCEDMRIGLKVYSLTSTSRSYKSTMVTARLREKVQMVKEKLDAEGNILDNRETKNFKRALKEPYAGSDNIILDQAKGDTYSVSIERGIRLLGFRKRVDVVRPELNLKPSQVMLPAEDDVEGSKVAFAALWEEMLRADLVAVCVAKMRAVGEPRMVALVPQRREANSSGVCIAPDCLWVVTLPYRDDFRIVPPKVLPSAAVPPSDAVEAARRVINGMQVSVDPHPSDFPNPDHARYVATLESLSLNTFKNQEDIERADKALETLPFSDKIHYKVVSWKASVDADFDEHFSNPPKKRAREPSSSAPKEKKAKKDPGSLPVFETMDDVLSAKLDTLRDYCRAKDIRVSGSKGDTQKRVADHWLANNA